MLLALSVLLALCVACCHAFVRPRSTAQVRRLQVGLPANTSLSASEYEGLISLLGNDTNLTSLYRASVHGSTFDDLLDRVGDSEPLVFVVRKDQYVFGTSINCGIALAEERFGVTDPPDACEMWQFSLAGHFDVPTKIMAPFPKQRVFFGRADWSEGRLSLTVRTICMGDCARGVHFPNGSNDTRSCFQRTAAAYLPEGYMGVRETDGEAFMGERGSEYEAWFGGDRFFEADEVEVLHAVSTRATVPEEALVTPVAPPPAANSSPSPVDGSSLSASEYDGLRDLLGDNKTLTSIYRSSADGSTLHDMFSLIGADKVREGWSAEAGTVFLIRKAPYVCGTYVSLWAQFDQKPPPPTSLSEGLVTPTPPSGAYLWYFSLSGHFDEPTRFQLLQEAQDRVELWFPQFNDDLDRPVGGLELRGFALNGTMSDWSFMGEDRLDVEQAQSAIASRYVPEGYKGVRNEFGDAYLGGAFVFTADEVEVLKHDAE